MPNPLGELLTLSEASREYHINQNTLRGWLYRRFISTYKTHKGGRGNARTTAVSRKELEEFLGRWYGSQLVQEADPEALHE